MTKGKNTKIISLLLRRIRYSKAAVVLFPNSTKKCLEVLGRNEEEYYVNKFAITGTLLCIGIISLVIYGVWHKFGALEDVEHLNRPQIDDEAVWVELESKEDGVEYLVEVQPRMLPYKEADKLAHELFEKLEKIILKDNESLDVIKSSLNLPETVEGYPFDIYWESDNKEVVNNTGEVNRYELKEDLVVTLMSTIYYGDWMWERIFPVCIAREELSEEEKEAREILQLILDKEHHTREDDYFQLPDVWREKKIGFGIRNTNTSLLVLAGLCMATGIMLWLGKDNDLKIERNKIRKVFEEEYVIFLSSLSMYISAGSSLQAAMNLCVKNYTDKKEKTNLFRNAIMDFQRDMQNGRGFSEAMDRFAEKADDVQYGRLAGILNQTIINGSRGLPLLLEEEVQRVQEEKRRKSKIKGEQISTALVAPMVLQLVIVMALIMLPAFSNMQF